MTEYLTPIIPPILKLIGYDVEVLPMSDEVSAELGLKFANNEVCYPATLIVGDIIKALKSGRYDLNNTAVVMSQTGGQCRATNYAGLIKRAMISNGFQDIPLLTLGVTASTGEASGSTDDKQDYNEQDGFNVPWLKYSQIIVTAIFYGDAINEMYNACIVRERKPGIARELRDKYMQLIDGPIAQNSAKGLIRLLEQAAEEFNQMTLERELPKVGIVGEIFLKFNPFAHQFLEQNIISRGIEVVPPLLAPFFLQEFVNVEIQKHMRLSCTKVPDFIIKGAYQALIGRRLRQVNKAAGKFRYFRPFTNIYDDAKDVQGLVSLAAQFGEGWLLPADIVGYIRDGVNNIISLQPFGCIANHVISKGIEKRLHDRFPTLNVRKLFIGYDHRFGHNREETFEDYVRYGREMGIEVIRNEAFQIDGINISSSVIRSFLKEGEVEMAARSLGFPYTLIGKVVNGFHEGRKLGFPTANLDISHFGQLIPAPGVYAVRVRLENMVEWKRGMMNVGNRPTLCRKTSSR